jgi:hypothetical protein
VPEIPNPIEMIQNLIKARLRRLHGTLTDWAKIFAETLCVVINFSLRRLCVVINFSLRRLHRTSAAHVELSGPIA